MILFPAIDILNQKAVRLLKGDYNKVTVYSDKPWEFAQDFVKKGCSAIHIVDLDGARTGECVNLETVKRIAQVKGLFSEIGGGIRNMQTISKYLEVGINRVILGTSALQDRAFLKAAIEAYSDKIAVGVDLADGKVAIRGWIEKTETDGFVFLQELQDLGVKTVIVTDISRDGAMKGTNLCLYEKIQAKLKLNVTASGGISTLDDLVSLKELGLYGAIIGKAYYSNAIKLEDALEVCR